MHDRESVCVHSAEQIYIHSSVTDCRGGRIIYLVWFNILRAEPGFAFFVYWIL